MDLSIDQKTLLTSNGVSGNVSVIDVPRLKVKNTIKVGRYPWGIAIKP
jgi:YVTN family beta-propeller protein